MQNPYPLVSVIVPVYNVEKYLPQCIESIINQDYENIELILVNDKSTDRSGDICDEYAAKFKNIRTVHKENNSGAGSSRNIGLDIACGSYVMFVDSDDFIDANMVSELYSLLLKTNSDIAGSQLTVHDDSKHMKKLDKSAVSITFYNSESVLKMLFLRILDCSPCTKLYKKSVIGTTRFIEGKTNEDIVFLFFVYLKCNYLVYIRESYYHYRINMLSVTKTFSKRNLDMYDNAEFLEQEVNRLDFDIKDVFSSYKNKISIDCCMLIIKNSARKQFAGLYKRYRDNCIRNFFEILMESRYSYKYKCKMIVILFCIK